METNDTCRAFVPGEMAVIPPNREGKLSSLTFAVKELYDVRGFVTGAGNPRWKETHPVAQTTAPAVERLLDEGATLLGKTISDEMAFSLNGENFHYGTPLNPKCPNRIPGGSSSGSASAVAGHLVDFALGTDTAGSMRIPASYCGIYGIRTTHGAVSLQGVHPMAPSFDAAGWFARTPDMLARVGNVLLGIDIPEFNTNRLIIARDLFDTGDASLAAKYDAFIQSLSGLPVEIAETELGRPDFSTWIETLRNIQWWELNQAHGEWIARNLHAFGAEIRSRLEKYPPSPEPTGKKNTGQKTSGQPDRKPCFPRHPDCFPDRSRHCTVEGPFHGRSRRLAPRYATAYLHRRSCRTAAGLDAAAGAG